MPRRNYLLIFAAAIVSLVCYRTADPLGRSFSQVADQIQRRYVDPVDRSALWQGAVRGMLKELGDPYSEYIEPKEAIEFEELLNQEFGGIGVYVGVDSQTDRPKIISPIVGSPAYRAGVLAGDIISKIDGRPTQGMKYSEATSLIRGRPGDSVQLTVERAGQPQPIELPPIRREIVNVESVLSDARDGGDHWNFLLQQMPNIGYVRIADFGEHTAAELRAALDQLRGQGLQALILDLRNNPGGLVTAAKSVCELFLPEGEPIVNICGRDGKVQQKYVAGAGEKFLDFPLAVLINESSASASEIVAACLQDNGRATVIGQRSYGKGTVQNVIPLRTGQGALKITTADYVRPSGHNIHRRPDAKDSDEWGVMPDKDFNMKLSTADSQKWSQWRRQRDIVQPHNENSATDKNNDWPQRDLTLLRAVEYLQTRLGADEKQAAASQP